MTPRVADDLNRSESGLGVPCVMNLDTLRQKTLAPALASARESGASAFGLHSRAEAMLAFARAFGWLVCAFHAAADVSGVTVGVVTALSTRRPGGERGRRDNAKLLLDAFSGIKPV